MPGTTTPDWQQLAIIAVLAALAIMLLQRIPVIGKFIRFAFSLAMMALLIFVLLRQAPFDPTLARFTSSLGLDDQQVVGEELKVKMAPDGHFWVNASLNGVPRRMLIDSGATMTAISDRTARQARVDTGTGVAPVVLRTANGMVPASTGNVDELKVGNIVARDLKVVTSPGLGNMDVLGMNFLSKLKSWRVEGRTLVLVPHNPQAAEEHKA